MNIFVYSSQQYEIRYLQEAFSGSIHNLTFCQERLTEETVGLAKSYPVVCVFVQDRLNASVLTKLKEGGTQHVAFRCAGHDNLDQEALVRLKMTASHVPAYSPSAVAEHAMALVLALARHIPQAQAQGRDGNYLLNSLVGVQLRGKTVGIVGTGKIGQAFGRIARGFGCHLVATDPFPSESFSQETGCRYLPLDDLLRDSDIVSLHIPLTPLTKHMLDEAALRRMKSTALLINTARGALIDTKALLEVLQVRRIGGAGLDVYENEAGVFFQDHSKHGCPDDTLTLLHSLKNVVLTGHQGFLTTEALREIATSTRSNLEEFSQGLALSNGLPRLL